MWYNTIREKFALNRLYYRRQTERSSSWKTLPSSKESSLHLNIQTIPCYSSLAFSYHYFVHIDSKHYPVANSSKLCHLLMTLVSGFCQSNCIICSICYPTDVPVEQPWRHHTSLTDPISSRSTSFPVFLHALLTHIASKDFSAFTPYIRSKLHNASLSTLSCVFSRSINASLQASLYPSMSHTDYSK